MYLAPEISKDQPIHHQSRNPQHIFLGGLCVFSRVPLDNPPVHSVPRKEQSKMTGTLLEPSSTVNMSLLVAVQPQKLPLNKADLK